MESQLRTWAATGQYTEEDDIALNPRTRAARRASGIGQKALVGVLVPVGVVMGVLFGAAVILRLLSLPLAAAFSSRQRGEEQRDRAADRR